MRDVISSAARILTATRLPMSMFSASYTAAIPPRPISRVTRNLPSSRVPSGTLDWFCVAMEMRAADVEQWLSLPVMPGASDLAEAAQRKSREGNTTADGFRALWTVRPLGRLVLFAKVARRAARLLCETFAKQGPRYLLCLAPHAAWGNRPPIDWRAR